MALLDMFKASVPYGKAVNPDVAARGNATIIKVNIRSAAAMRGASEFERDTMIVVVPVTIPRGTPAAELFTGARFSVRTRGAGRAFILSASSMESASQWARNFVDRDGGDSPELGTRLASVLVSTGTSLALAEAVITEDQNLYAIAIAPRGSVFVVQCFLNLTVF